MRSRWVSSVFTGMYRAGANRLQNKKLLQDVPEWLQDFKENLVDKNVQPHQYSLSSSHELTMEPRAKVVPGPGKHSIFSHFPKDRNYDICFHKVLSEGCESRHNHGYAVVVQDLATQWIQSCQCKTKTSQET